MARVTEVVVADQDVRPVGGERAPTIRERVVPGNVDDQVVALGAAGEIRLRVVDHVVCADRADQLQLLRAVHARHVRAVRLRELESERSHTTAGAVDQDLLPRLQLLLVAGEVRVRDQPGGGDGRGLLERQPGRLQRERGFGNRRVLGKGAAVVPLIAADCLAEHLVTRVKPCHVLSDRLDAPCHVRSRNRVLRLAQPGSHHAQRVRQAPHDVPDVRMDGRRVDPHQHVIVLHGRPVDVCELQDVDRAVLVLDDRLHRARRARRRPCSPACAAPPSGRSGRARSRATR